MKNSILSMALVSAAILGGIVGAGIAPARAAYAKSQFDYESCQAIVAKGDLGTNPGVPDHWREMVTTPGGNWCIR
jgi:hypothetical protein